MTERKQNRAIRESRLLASEPEKVYAELEEYGRIVKEGHGFGSDSELEMSLLARNDRLIDLALAQFCSSKDVWHSLYMKSKAVASGVGERYLKGLRVACLSNEVVRSYGKFHVFEQQELTALLRDADSAEVQALLVNSSISGEILIQLFRGDGPFALLPEDRRLMMIYWVVENPRLVDDTSDEHGPDLYYTRIHDAIFGLLITAPVTWDWLDALHHLHFHLVSARNRDSDLPISQVIQRWEGLQPPDNKLNDDGSVSGLSKKEEFIALVSAMYGTHFSKEGGEYKRNVVGTLDSTDLSERCAFYGNGELTAQDIESGHRRDRKAFLVAALCNDYLYLDSKLRSVLEERLTHSMQWIYFHRCAAIAKRCRDFNPKPVNAHEFQEIETQQCAEVTAINSLQTKLSALESKLADTRSMLLYGFVALALLIWFR